jgi:hypothetical protein
MPRRLGSFVKLTAGHRALAAPHDQGTRRPRLRALRLQISVSARETHSERYAHACVSVDGQLREGFAAAGTLTLTPYDVDTWKYIMISMRRVTELLHAISKFGSGNLTVARVLSLEVVTFLGNLTPKALRVMYQL